MDITYTSTRNPNEPPRTESLERLAIAILGFTDPDTRGEAETAREIATNGIKCLAKLIDILASRGLLADDDLNDLLSHWSIKNITHA